MSLIDRPPESLLIIRLSAIGDVIMASALIPALRAAYPSVHLAWLTDETNAGLLRHNPRLDQLIIWPRRRWRQLIRQRRYREWFNEVRILVKTLRDGHFDLVLDLQGLMKSAVWAFLSGGRKRIGLGSREGSQFLMSRVISRQVESVRIGKEYLQLARELGIEPGPFPMDVAVSEQETQEASALLQSMGITSEFAVIAPCTTRPQKHWFDERWAELSRRLAAESGLAVLMLGGSADQARAEAITATAPRLINLVGHTSLGHCGAIIRSARLLVGVDTGLTHLGIAMRTPTVALFGSTRPYLETGFAGAKVLYEPLPCSPCRRHPTCGGEFTCMRLHTVDRVLTAGRRLMEQAA